MLNYFILLLLIWLILEWLEIGEELNTGHTTKEE